MSYGVENNVRKGEIACYKQFLLFSACFPQLYIYSASKCGVVWQLVNKRVDLSECTKAIPGNVAQTIEFVFASLENVVEIGENTRYQRLFPRFPAMFSKGFFLTVVKICHCLVKPLSHSDKEYKDRIAFLKLDKGRENGMKCSKKNTVFKLVLRLH